MKQIFDWLRGQIGKRTDGFNSIAMIDVNRVHDIIDEAEAKWEADYCELLDKLIKEAPQYRHGVCAFRNEEECVDFEYCENCLVDAVKDIIKNSDSRFRKISEVE
jgi:hypothetical protein